MRVFLTGATGFIGTEVGRQLLAAGHEVLGLARSDTSVATLEKLGAQTHRGDLLDHRSLAEGAREADGVIHLAFNYQDGDLPKSAETDLEALEVIVEALAGSGKALVSTSVTGILQAGRPGSEQDAPAAGSVGYFRAPSEEATLAARHRGVRASVVRLPPTVHGAGDKAFVAGMIGACVRTGVSAYAGTAQVRWPAVHRADAARLYIRALEAGEAGSRYHAVAEESVSIRSIAELLARKLDIPSRALHASEVGAHFGWLAKFVTMDNPVSSEATRRALGWSPTEVDLLADIEMNYGLDASTRRPKEPLTV